MKYRAMYKYELAVAAGVTRQTLRNWMQSDRVVLKKMGVEWTQKVLPPCAVKYMCEKYDIDI